LFLSQRAAEVIALYNKVFVNLPIQCGGLTISFQQPARSRI